MKGAILIAGPTASGKSALALDIAERIGGVIVNADSMQVYDGLAIVTARPGPADLARAPHLLYGHVDPGKAYSTGAWLRDVSALIESDQFKERTPIFVGGTGLYFRALTEGLAEMPEIPRMTRDRWRYHLMEDGPQHLHRILSREDPKVAAMLKPTDGQRLVRALEVLEASGRSILDWQAMRDRPLLDLAGSRCFVLDVPRAEIVDRIERRFDRMVADGALAEVESLSRRRLDPGLPAMKAIGVPEFRAALAGETTIDEAIERAKIATRQYAKRQVTWFRHQLGPLWQRLDGARAEDLV